jgi:hypothetical protein
MSHFEEIAAEIGKTVTTKNKVYGNSFGRTADFIKVLYPDGIRVDQYDDVLLMVRIFDKLVRIANGAKDEENPYFDIAGYAVLGVDMKGRVVRKPEVIEVKKNAALEDEEEDL